MKLSPFVLACCLVAGCGKNKPVSQPVPVPVIASEVLVRDQLVHMENMGQALGSRDVEIRARVEGILESMHFSEGSFIKSNELLYVIEPRALIASLDQAKGNLAQTEAALDKANRDVLRLQPLWERNAISRQALDDAFAAERSASSAVTSARAALESTEIELGYAKIHAPIDGLVGKTEVRPGNLVGRGQNTLLTTMSSLDPIHYRFSVSERDYLAWKREGPDRDSPPDKPIFELLLADGTVHAHKGRVVFADRNVDSATGTLLIEVAFPNPDRLVRPGQFGKVRMPVKFIKDAILVPQRAVQELQASYSVYVVRADNTVELRKVEPGPRIGSLMVIASGLLPGEKIVVEGLQKLRNRTLVTPTIRIMEDTQPAPAGE